MPQLHCLTVSARGNLWIRAPSLFRPQVIFSTWISDVVVPQMVVFVYYSIIRWLNIRCQVSGFLADSPVYGDKFLLEISCLVLWTLTCSSPWLCFSRIDHQHRVSKHTYHIWNSKCRSKQSYLHCNHFSSVMVHFTFTSVIEGALSVRWWMNRNDLPREYSKSWTPTYTLYCKAITER